MEGLRHGQLSEDILERKMKYAREYLAALDIVDAGISHNRGITIWELQSVNTFLCNKRFQVIFGSSSFLDLVRNKITGRETSSSQVC